MGWKLIPSTPDQNTARSWLMDNLQKDLQFPTQDIAEMTPFQQELQSYLQQSMPGMQQNYELSQQQLQDTLQGGYNPQDSPYWKGYRQTANQMKADSQTDIRQRSQLGGMLKSSPSANVEADSNRQYDSMMLRELGQLYENERNKMYNAAQVSGQVTSQQTQNLAQATALGNLPREIEQQQNDAMYEAAMQELLAPYQYQYKLAEPILSETRYYYKSKSKSGFSSALGGALGTGLGIAGGALLGGALLGGSGGLWAGGNAAPGLGGTLTSTGTMFA